ncbi:MAG: glycosyltransferase family 4 protein [Acidobacteria bacterium]|nr:glycosyltransferase family 4 protein [Acidobacteriota bacterium]MBU4306292.1 glycosyltransferase family 4 protein [Acidobacteriota bacterium]MCG2812359.1 glycosyltransferase family 4 protein [Candidatus Aminicenantes bacterium]
MSRKIAVVVQRYGLEINGGAEYHARLIAEKLSKYFTIEVFTTTACDYVTWDHHYRGGQELLNGIKVNRFRVRKPRDPETFGRIQRYIFEEEHVLEDELSWLEEEGPLVPELLQALEKREKEFAYFIFFSYRYYHSYYGVSKFRRKAILVPTAEHDQVVYLSLFKDFFNLPAAIVYNSLEEKELINRISGNAALCGDVVGVGSEIPEGFDPRGTWARLGIQDKYFVYIGRLDENKGVPELFDFYLRLLAEKKITLKLLLIGKTYISIPEHENIVHIGFQENKEKFDLLQGADFLVMPSQFESLSMVALEAWAIGKPVLANGKTEVLRGQCQRSQGGLWYGNYDEFKEAFLILQADGDLRERLGANGKKYFLENYSWETIENKYLKIIAALDQRR